MNITLKQLRYFEALARRRHFGLAAADSAISQPALSMQIKELEQTLGLPLFDRTTREVQLTGFGEIFEERCRDILRSVDALDDLARAARGGLADRLRLGVIPTIAPYLLPRLLGDLADAFDGIDIHIRETLTEKLIQELNEGRLDTAIIALPVAEPGLQEIPLFDEAFVLVRPHAQSTLPVPKPTELQDVRLLLLEEGHCFRDQALAHCDIRSAAPRDGLDGSSLSTLVQMVSAGLGLTLVPEMAVPVETRSAEVSVARFEGRQPRRTIGMVWRKSTPMGAQLERIAQIVQNAGRDLRAARDHAQPS